MSEIEKPNRLVDGLLERAQKAESERDEWKNCSEKAKMQLGDWRACAISNATRAQKAEAELERAQRMFQRLAKSRDDWKRLARDNEARAEKAEAALESAQKMRDGYTGKAWSDIERLERLVQGVTAERDALLAQVEAIAGERDRFKAKLIKIQEETK